jgi:hypothetical protein
MTDHQVATMTDQAEMKKLKWIIVIARDTWVADLGGSWIAVFDEETEEALDICSDKPGRNVVTPRYDLRQLLEWAIDHGYFEGEDVCEKVTTAETLEDDGYYDGPGSNHR